MWRVCRQYISLTPLLVAADNEILTQCTSRHACVYAHARTHIGRVREARCARWTIKERTARSVFWKTRMSLSCLRTCARAHFVPRLIIHIYDNEKRDIEVVQHCNVSPFDGNMNDWQEENLAHFWEEWKFKFNFRSIFTLL